MLALVPGAWATGETITVTATGLGQTVEAARKSAIQKAVRKALGEIVDAETITDKEQVIKDEVISYSDGFVSKTIDVEGPSLDEDLRLYTLTLQAEVVRSKVIKRLREVNVKVVEVSGESLFAQAVSKSEKNESGKQLLAKALNEDLDPAKLIKCELVSRGADGKLIRGKPGPNAIRQVPGSNDQFELTLRWEVSYDLDGYYKRALPRLSKAINQVSKRKVSGNVKRVLDFDQEGRRAIHFAYPTRRTLLYSFFEDNIMFEQTDRGIEFANGTGDKLIHYDEEPKDSRWRITSPKEEFFVAFELRGNPDRTECDFEVHVLDASVYLDLFRSSPSRVLPSFLFSAKSADGTLIAERKISNPVFLCGNDEDKELKGLSAPLIPRFQKDLHPLQLQPMGLVKSPYHLTRHAYFYTISPEFLVHKDHGSSALYNSQLFGGSAMVFEVKETLSKEQLLQVKDLVLQPLSPETKSK
jgi:hypothetical protein